MTLPMERTRSTIAASDLLAELAKYANRRGKTVSIPRILAIRASLILRHYPWRCDIALAAESCPSVFSKP